MAPISSKHLLAVNIPVIAALLGYLWFKKKRIVAKSDPGDKESAAKTDASANNKRSSSTPLDIEPNSLKRNPLGVEGPFSSASCAIADTPQKLCSVEGSPSRNFSRSYSAPIPIVPPKGLRSTRTLNISDEELDQHIEKIKSSLQTKIDPFELINQGKITNCASPSKKSSQQISFSPSPPKEKSTVEADTIIAKKVEESTGASADIEKSSSIPLDIEPNSLKRNPPNTSEEKLDQHIVHVKIVPLEQLMNIRQISVSASTLKEKSTVDTVKVVEELKNPKADKIIAEKVEEIVEQVISKSKILEAIANQEVEEIIAEQDIQQEAISSVEIPKINPALTTAEKMTSTSNNTISGGAGKAQEINFNRMDSMQKSPSSNSSTSTLKEALGLPSLKDWATEIDLDETLTEERLNSVKYSPRFGENRPSFVEYRPSSAEEGHSSAEERLNSTEERPSSAEENSSAQERPSSAEERSNSVEPVPGSSTGAIPKQKKKKKFRKLNCDLKDVGAKLMNETQKKSDVKAPKKNDQKSRNDSGCEREDTNPHNSRRQSANPSPCDTMLFVSSSLSSLNESENSHDSGKGCSDEITTPPPQPVNSAESEENTTSFYEFLLNKDLVGKLIGKRGCFVNLIYTKTNAHVIVKDHPYDTKNKICIVDGTADAIKKAMKMIRYRFPREKLEQFSPHDFSQRSEPFLVLPAATNLETQISCMVTPNHLFLQQPFHPTYPHLMQMHDTINRLYETEEPPLLPKPVAANNICVAYTFRSWNRAQILSVDEENETAYIRALDFGGYAYVPFSKLKQMRSDLITLPFQATECFLANIEPVGGEWSRDAYTLISNLTRGVMLYTHVVDFTEENIPLVNCQVLRNEQIIWINLELVNQGYAKWIEEIPSTSSQVDEIASISTQVDEIPPTSSQVDKIPSTSSQVDTRTPVEC